MVGEFELIAPREAVLQERTLSVPLTWCDGRGRELVPSVTFSRDLSVIGTVSQRTRPCDSWRGDHSL
jgi:hypothetical protein